MKRKTIIETIIFLYTSLFLYTAISKLTEYDTFKEQLSESPVLGPFASLVAIAVPSLELLIIVLLIVPRWRMKGLYAAFVLMTVFTIYVIALLSFTDKLPCSCGGVIAQLSWPQHIIFNLAFIGLAILGIIVQRRELNEVERELRITYAH